MDLVKQWYGNGLSAGDLGTSTAGDGDDAFSAVNGPPTVEVDGTNPYVTLTESGSSRNFRWDITGGLTSWSSAFHYWATASPSTTVAIIQLTTAGLIQIARLEHTTTGGLTLRNAANTSIATAPSGTIVAGNKYWTTIVGNNTGAVTVKIYAAGSGTPITTLSGSTGSTDNVGAVRYGSVASATSSGRNWDNLAVGNDAVEIPQPDTTAWPVRMTANPGVYTATGGGSLTDVVADNSDSTYAQSPTEPDGDSVTYRLAPLSREDIVTAVVRGAASDASPSISRLIEIVHSGSAITSRTDTLTTTPTNYTLTSPSPVAAGEVVYVRVTDTTL